MKILLFGKSGQVGWELQRSLAPLGDVVALDFDSTGALSGDFTKPDAIAATVRAVRPEVIVNAAAYTAVDKAESEPETARMVNAIAPGVLAREAQACGAVLVHYSTDYVFDGSGEHGRRETDATAPLNVYGMTKLEAEQLVLAHCKQSIILRTSWVYAARGGNFAKTMLRLARTRDQMSVIADQVGAPTGADLLADLTAHLVRLGKHGPNGLYHVAAAGEVSWFDYAKFVLERASESGAALKVQAHEIQPVRTEDFPTAARRPKNSRLDSSMFRATTGLVLPDWRQGVRRMLDEVLTQETQ